MNNKKYFNYFYLSLFIILFILALTNEIQYELRNKNNILDIFFE